MITAPDYHVHTHFSNDCRSEMAAVCEAAISRGIREIAFADHLDFGGYDPALNDLDVPAYLAEIARCRRLYGDRLTIVAGVEVGEGHLYRREAAAILDAFEFDLVLGSLHYVDRRPVWDGCYFLGQTLEEGLEAYFSELALLVASADLDVLGHFDIVLRAAHQAFGRTSLDYAPYEDAIRGILCTLVERGKGLEINTATLQRGMAATNPPLQVVRWYRELGGEILTLGSDAHTAGSVGGSFAAALALVRVAGFEQLARFENRQAVLTKISPGVPVRGRMGATA